MKKLTALILLLCILANLSSCSKRKGTSTPTDEKNPNTENTQNQPEAVPTIVVPEYKDYGRDTANFDALFYQRPDIQALVNGFNEVTAAVANNAKTAQELIADIRALEKPLENVKTMCALVEINHAADASLELWKVEREYVGSNYPNLSQAVEKLLTACAKSADREIFENNYFGYSLEEYSKVTVYTDEVVALMQEEARLEADYSSLSTSTVEITYKRTGTDKVFEGTVDEVKEMLREYFANDEYSYAQILFLIDELYQQKLRELVKPIYIDLIKVRRLIADELGYDSYSKLAYKTMGYDYSADDMLTLLNDVSKYIAPVASELEYEVFYNYFSTNYQPKLTRVSLINTLYEVYSGMGGNYKDAYSYMLQHSLYNVNEKQENRFEGAFSTYLENNASPYVFMTTTGFVRDYNTLAHEFGHFLDSYINFGDEDSLAIMEVSSQALELLTLAKLKGHIYTTDYKYLEYYTMFDYLSSVIMMQSFYATFEHMVYELEYDEITEEKLEDVVDKAFRAIYGDVAMENYELSDMIITHTALYPFYVESYVTSSFVSLDIFFAENAKTGKSGEGLKMYESLINREEKGLSFTERLEKSGLDSPFATGKVQDTADYIYYYITGKYYYKTDVTYQDAA